MELKAWLPLNDGAKWDEQFNFDPFDSIGFGEDDGLSLVENLNADQIRVSITDSNPDNFQDVVISYAVDGGVYHLDRRGCSHFDLSNGSS